MYICGMEVKINEETTISLTEEDVENIINLHLKEKGYNVDNISWQIHLEYDGYDDHYGSHMFKGAIIKANSKEHKKEL